MPAMSEGAPMKLSALRALLAGSRAMGGKLQVLNFKEIFSASSRPASDGGWLVLGLPEQAGKP